MTTDPYDLDDNDLPNITSALGSGYKNIVKPDIYFPGGKEHVGFKRTRGINDFDIQFSDSPRAGGLKVATTDSQGSGELNRYLLTNGTSFATGLATKAAHMLFDICLDEKSALKDMPRVYYAVVIKALLIHHATWREGRLDLLKRILGPESNRLWHKQRDNVSSILGYGLFTLNKPHICSENKAVLVSCGAVEPKSAVEYSVPLPESLKNITEWKSVKISLAWHSPINPISKNYVIVKLKVEENCKKSFEVKRLPHQPNKTTSEKGTVFHAVYEGEKAATFIDGGYLKIKISSNDFNYRNLNRIRFGLVVTIESVPGYQVYNGVKQRLEAGKPKPRLKT